MANSFHSSAGGGVLLCMNNVSVTLQNNIQALRNISLSVRRGEHSALLGPNGAGKSTLLRAMRAECFPASIQGQTLWYPHGAAESAPLAGRELCALVSTAHTELYLRRQWDITGEELIVSGLRDSPLLYHPVSDEERNLAIKIAETLALTELLHTPVNALSQMRISMLLFARACIRRPRLLLLDEFIDGLDMRCRMSLLDSLEEMTKESTLIFATHRPENLPPFVRRAIRMEEGRITAVETLENTSPNDGISIAPEAATLKNGKNAVISLKNVHVYIDGAAVLRDMDWNVYAGEHWTLAGEPGSGKSTLMRLIAGDLYPACGGSIVRIMPGEREPLRTLPDIRKNIRLVSGSVQANYAYDIMGEELVCTGLSGDIGIHYEPGEAERAEARACLDLVDASRLADRPIRSLSTGQLRRLFLARALVGAPKILLLDDPFAGLDERSRTRIKNLLLKLVDSRAIQIIISASSPGDLPLPMSRLALLREGRLERR